MSTIRVRLAGVADQHVRSGLLDPTGHVSVVGLVGGLAKLRATRPVRKRPLLLADVQAVITAMDHGIYPDGISAARDELAIWLGFAGALRRSEAAALRLDSVELHVSDGVYIHVGKSKADPTNTASDVVVLPQGRLAGLCPACAVHRWVHLLTATNSRREQMAAVLAYQSTSHVCGVAGPALVDAAALAGSAPLLRATYRNAGSAAIHEAGISGGGLHAMLRGRLARIGLNPDEYGFHSLRAGHVTQARRNGATTQEVMRAGRWARAETVEVYDREYDPLSRNSVLKLGL